MKRKEYTHPLMDGLIYHRYNASPNNPHRGQGAGYYLVSHSMSLAGRRMLMVKSALKSGFVEKVQ